jgi:hypothetical protein
VERRVGGEKREVAKYLSTPLSQRPDRPATSVPRARVAHGRILLHSLFLTYRIHFTRRCQVSKKKKKVREDKLFRKGCRRQMVRRLRDGSPWMSQCLSTRDGVCPTYYWDHELQEQVRETRVYGVLIMYTAATTTWVWSTNPSIVRWCR